MTNIYIGGPIFKAEGIRKQYGGKKPVIRGVRSKLKWGGGGHWLSGALFHKNRAPSSKFIYGGYTTQLSLKLLNSECL